MDIDRTATVQAERTIDIAASEETVWNLITSFSRWPEWNFDISDVTVEGGLQPGTVVRWRGGGLPIESTVREVVPFERIVWTGRTIGTNAVHCYELHPHQDGVQVVTRESFTGWLPALLPRVMQRALDQSLTTGVVRLKETAERTGWRST